VTRPKLKHSLIQRNLRKFFESVAELSSWVDSNIAFPPLSEHALWVANVAYVTRERFDQAIARTISVVRLI
jgi:hypothetical protein